MGAHTRLKMLKEALELIEDAKKIVEEALDNYDDKIEYERHDRFGFNQLLGIGGDPYAYGLPDAIANQEDIISKEYWESRNRESVISQIEKSYEGAMSEEEYNKMCKNIREDFIADWDAGMGEIPCDVWYDIARSLLIGHEKDKILLYLKKGAGPYFTPPWPEIWTEILADSLHG